SRRSAPQNLVATSPRLVPVVALAPRAAGRVQQSKARMARTVDTGLDGSTQGGAGATSGTPSASDAAYETVRQKIIDGEFYPSQRLIEAQLAQALGYSRH